MAPRNPPRSGLGVVLLLTTGALALWVVIALAFGVSAVSRHGASIAAREQAVLFNRSEGFGP